MGLSCSATIRPVFLEVATVKIRTLLLAYTVILNIFVCYESYKDAYGWENLGRYLRYGAITVFVIPTTVGECATLPVDCLFIIRTSSLFILRVYGQFTLSLCLCIAAANSKLQHWKYKTLTVFIAYCVHSGLAFTIFLRDLLNRCILVTTPGPPYRYRFVQLTLNSKTTLITFFSIFHKRV